MWLLRILDKKQLHGEHIEAVKSVVVEVVGEESLGGFFSSQ